MQPRFTYQMCFAWHERPFFLFRFSPLCVLFFCLKGQQQQQETTREERDRDRGKQSENAIRETVDSKSESEMKLTQNPYAEQFH